MNLCEVQKGYSFTVKLDYNDMRGLVSAFYDFRIEPVDPIFMITAFKVAGNENLYQFYYYCGLGESESMFFQFSIESDVESDTELETCALKFLENRLDNIDWFEILRECREKYEPKVLKEWMESKKGLNLKWALEHFIQEAEALNLVIYYNGEICTGFWLITSIGEWPMPVFSISDAQNPIEKKETAQKNYEIYLRLLYQFFGMEPFIDDKKVIKFDQYLEAIQKISLEDSGTFKWCWKQEHTKNIARLEPISSFQEKKVEYIVNNVNSVDQTLKNENISQIDQKLKNEDISSLDMELKKEIEKAMKQLEDSCKENYI